MKKGLLFGIFMIVSVVLLAQENASAYDAGSAVAQHETHVTPAQALNVGYTFMRTGAGANTGTRGGTRGSEVREQAMQLVYTGQAYDSLTGTITDCYYVFALQPKGFVIVAADDRVEPILGYSYDNDFAVANMPDHVRAWLGSYERQIEAVAKSNLQPTPATESKWTDLRSGQSTGTRSGGTVGPLLTTTWDQSQYYNSLCPADANGPDGHALTGCVATAMAQIIHYWGYPVHGRGAHSYYGNYGELTVNYANANYDHSLMPDALTSTSTTQEVDAVASLMRDCGVAVNMGYSPTESSSFDQDARAALINFYRYSPNLSFAEKAYFSDSEWNAMLHADLDNSRPVFYSGQGSGGHAFVCDGYDSDGYYHFNFGWGGFADGWFLTSSITPGGSNFNDSQAAIFGIVPDSTGNVILGQTQGTSTFTVDEPLEFYHLMGHNAYEGGNYDNGCNNTIHFIPANSTNQIVADILDYEDQTLNFSDGDGNSLRSLVGGSDNDYSPVVSNHNALNIAYSGNMYYAGFKLNISQTDNNGCRMVSNITTFVDTTTVHLTWAENGTATQWGIEYGIKGFELGTGTISTTTTNTADFYNLQPITEYDFYIRAICDSTHYGPWSKTTLMVEGPYWQDIVTSQPAGYVYNAQTNSVEITTAEQLAWWAKTGNGIDGHLAADIDLSGHRWQPTILSGRNFNGHGHVITNLYVIQGNGFFSQCAEGCIIENVGLTNAYINNSEASGLCGYLRGTMRNCYVTNSLIQAKNDANLAESYAGGLVCFNLGLIINCYANANVISYYQGGLLACYSYGTIRNCYATGTLPLLSWCYYGSIAAVVSGEISHCYSDDACPANFISFSVGLTTITDVSFFENTGNGCSLLTPIVFEDVTENDLLSALNRGVEMYNDSAYCTWMADTGNRNGGFPVFGNHYVNLCPNVTDISIQNVIVDNQHAVTIGWTENGDVSQLLIRYKDHFQPDTAYSYVMATRNPDTLFGIPLGYEYDFNVRAICDTDYRSSWGETWREIIDLPYWTDIVTTKPDGYVEDADGNVEIYSTEGLVWLAVMMNGPYNQLYHSAFAGKTVTLKSDIDLSGYRWDRIGHENDWGQGAFCGTFDGQNHRISNIYMNSESGGLFGGVWNGGVVKNVILEGGSITCGRGYGGGLIGRAAHSTEISNCHVSTTVHSRYSVSTGALCGEIQSSNSNPTMVSNCSASGTVYGGSGCGNLIGHMLGNVVIRNCYATGNVHPASEISDEVYCRGVMIGTLEGGIANNCFSTGMAYNCLPSEMNVSNSGCYGNVIGCLSQPNNMHYLYGQNNVNAGVVGYGLDGATDNPLFTHSGNANTLLTPVSIQGTNYSDLLDALNAWVILQNDTALRTWVLDTLTGYPVFGDYYVPSCYTPTDLIVSQATAVGDPTIKTRLAWTQRGEPDHWEVLYVASGESMESGTIIPVNNNPCVMAGIPVGEPLDFYVRAVCGDADTSAWCSSVSYIPDKLRWTEVVTSQPEGYKKDSDGNVYISSAEGLAWVSSVINRLNGNNSYYWFGDIILTEDIDMSAYRWTTIGNSWETACYHSFNGNNHVVSGLYCNELSAYQGFFGIMQRNIQNLTLSQCDIHGLYETGALAGHCNDVNIRNCIVNGKVSGPNSSMLIGASYRGTIENSCFISKDNKHGNPAATGGGSNDIVNFYVGDSDSSATSNHYYNSSTYFGDFSGNGYSWTLNSPLYINGAFHSDLLDALNTWVDANNINGQYRRWVADTAMVNGGYPIFESVSYPAVGAHDTVMATGYYSWHGMVFTSDTVVNDTITTLIGYDSVVTHYIIVIPSLLTEITVDTCSSYIWNSETYSKTGDYVQTFPSVGGGDSVVVLHLSINPLTGVDEQIACGNSYMWIDGVTYVANNYSATHRLQTADGCDSVVTLHLTFGNNIGDTTALACDTFDWYEHTNLTQNGDYTHTFTNASGCDSVVTLHLIFGNNTGDTTAVACDSFDWYEQTNLTQSGDYSHTFTNASGCDSVVTLHLTVNHSVTEFVEATACDSYTWNGSVYTQSGDYTQTFTAANGCDSVITLHLTVNNSNSGDTTAVACDSFDWYEYTYLIMSGDYTHVFTNQNGCDSVVTLHLTVNHSVAEFVETTACNSYIWNDSVYTQSGDYTQTFTNDNGCDSLVTLHLTVNYTIPPTVTTGTVNDITPYSAICSDNVIADGCAEVAERGVCWNTSQHPTIADAHTSDGDEAGTFTSLLVGLEPSTTYYMRAYATNSEDTVYGEELMFTTASQFTCGENLVVGYYSYTTMNYGSQCWMTQNLRNTSSNYFDYPDVLQACPTGWHLPDNNDWNTLGIYLPSSSVYFGNGDYWTSTLIPYQTYQGEQFTLISPPYVNSNSVSFSSGTACEVHDAAQGICQVHTELSVRCLRNENAYAALPTVTTQTASNIMPNTATCGGIVTADGGATVTERGVCWSVSENPTIADSHTINGGGAGAFTSQLTGLELNITYHVRAYATNSAGTAYGEDVTFTTDLCGTLSISISGEDGISHICESEPVTLIANVEADGFTPENLHYTWYEDGQVRDNMTFGLGDTNVYAEYWASRNSIYTFFVEVTYGTHLSCVAQSEERYVRVYPQPATPVVTVDQTSIYDGGQVVLSATSADLYNISYTWYKNGVVIPGATGANIVDNPTTVGGEATQYVYTVEASHLYTGCTSEPSEPTVVMVRVTPTATVTAEGDTVLCEGDSTTLHVNVTPANNSYSYQWYEDGVLIPGATSADYVVSKHARYSAYNFAVRVSESGGFDILVPGPVITVAQPPFVTAFASKTDICEGGTATLTLWVNGSSTTYGYNFQWFRSTPYPDGTSDTNLVGTSSTYTTPSNVPINSYTYWVQATSEYGCIGQSDPITLTINPNPSVTISGNTTFCVGSTTTLYANVTPDQNASYVWYKDGVEAGSHANYITVTNGGVYMVKATVNDCKATDYITITVNDLPATPVVTVDNDIVFEGDQVTLSVTNPIPNATYTWYRSGEIIPNTNQASLIDYPMTIDGESTLHTYTVVAALDISGCVSDVSDYTWVTVFPTPEANVTVNGDTMFCEGGFTTLRVNVTPNNGPSYTYQWYEDGMPIPGATYSSYYVNKPARSTPYNFHVVVSANGSYNVTAFAPAVTIVADPQVEITMADGYPAAFCDGGSTVLQANATGGLGDFSYQWYKNGSTLAGETSQTLALNNLYYGMYDSYTVRVTQYGASCAAFSDLQMVRVYLLRYNTLYKTTCEDYTWNGITYAQTGEYTQTFTGANGCDSIVTLHLTVNYANSGDTTAVADDRFDWYEHTYLTMSGDYTHVFTNQNGCDSVITLHLTVNNPTISVQDTVMTAGYFIWHGMVFTSDTVLTEIIPVLDGYDSLMVYHIFVTPTPLTVLTVNACISYTLNGQTYTESGDYVQTFPISSGIDSVVVLYLTIFPADSAEFAETACESFTWEGTTYTSSGDYTKTFTNVNGCDSVVTLHLTIFPADSAEFAETACEFFTWEGTTYTSSGDYTQTFTNTSGCDSVVTLHLTVNYGTHNVENETACESFTWHDATYTTSGTYTYEYTNASGCASVDTLYLTVNYSTHNVETETACENFMWYGTEYTASGTYTYGYSNATGCASVDTLYLTVNHGTHNVETETACESFTWHGATYATSGTYTYEYNNAAGCASVDTLHLTVNYGIHNVETETACESFTWHGATYTTSGTYTYEYTNANGCVSVDTLHLTVNHGTHNVETETACESYEWHGVTYNASGTYTYDYTNASGCVSVDTLHLTVNHGTHYVESETACESFTWHGTEYTASGTYTYEYTNADGCASVDTLHLTINFAQSAQFAVTTADSCYIWNAETYCESGDYTQTLTAANGCDSTVTLHLTITVGIDDHNGFAFNLYPNPTNGMVNVQCTMNNVQVGTMEFHVFDAYGKLVGVVETRCTTSLQTAQIDLSGFAAGVYFVKAVADGNVVAVRKVVKR